MRIRRHVLTSTLGLMLVFTWTPMHAAIFNAWATYTDRDEMEGTSEYYVLTESQNRLDGWLRSGKLILGYNCQTQGLYVRANSLGFDTEDTDTGGGYLERLHYARLKVDDGDTRRGTFHIWEDNNDGMTLKRIQGGGIETLVSEMKAGSIIRVEVSLFNTKGREQIARFSLMGFTAATSWCAQQDN